MARPETTGRHRRGPSRLLLPATTMAGLALGLSFGVTRVMEGILSAQGGEAVDTARRGADGETTPQGAEGTPARRDYFRVILGRDIFATGLAPRGDLWTPPQRGFPIDDAQLIATVVAEDPLDSSALIALDSGEDQIVQVFGPGDILEDGGRITGIDQGRVTLQSQVGEVRHLVMGMRAEL